MKQNGNVALILAVVVAIGASFAAGYFYLKSQTPIAIKTSPRTTGYSSPTPIDVVTPTATLVSATATPKAGHTAVVVFEPPLGGDFADKAAIQTKIVNPFLDYYADENGEGFLVSLSIEKNVQESKTAYPYTASAIFKNGGTSGFTIAKTDGVIPWWTPDCMKCTFSTSFKTKYPEIVKLYE